MDKLIPNEIRKEIIELSKIYMDGHIAPSLSCVEILASLYEIKKEKDKIILSKGHGCLCLYAILRKLGYNPIIGGHPDIEVKEGIECTTGSLGHGLPIGFGMAFAKKYKKERGKIYVVLGDGECQEGTIWESLNLIKKFNLKNIKIIIDNNGLQATSKVEDKRLKEKFIAFGMKTTEVDGHSKSEIKKALKNDVIIANTIKGKGIKFMENKVEWHSRRLKGELFVRALRGLE